MKQDMKEKTASKIFILKFHKATQVSPTRYSGLSYVILLLKFKAWKY